MIPQIYFLFNFQFGYTDEECLVITAVVVDDLVLSTSTC